MALLNGADSRHMVEKRVYVAGFLLKGDYVLLVEKNRPKWQAGYLNGIGGGLIAGEEPRDAMIREFYEETGKRFTEWVVFANEEGPGYDVFFYRLRVPLDFDWIPPHRNDVGESLHWLPFNTKRPIIGNLNWLLPLTQDPRRIVVMAKTDSDISEIRTW